MTSIQLLLDLVVDEHNSDTAQEPYTDIVTLTAPSHWASYFIDGDATGLSDEEQAEADRWLDHVGLGDPVSAEDAGWIHYHDARIVGAGAADCAEYTFYGSSHPLHRNKLHTHRPVLTADGNGAYCGDCGETLG